MRCHMRRWKQDLFENITMSGINKLHRVSDVRQIEIQQLSH
jgi:hypothetical protein